MAKNTYNSRVQIEGDKSTFRRENTTQFMQTKVAEKNPQLILNANVPLSERRDQITEQNGATVVQDGAEYRLRATSTTDSKAVLRSRKRGNYISGAVLEAGMGLRIPNQPTGDAIIRWGYFWNDNGLFWEYDADGFRIVVNKGGNRTEIPQSEWNIDRLDGSDGNSNPSGETLDLSDGAVFQIPFVYYGYGAIDFEIGLKDSESEYFMRSVHQQKMDGQISTEEPNLPLAIEVDSKSSGQQLDVFVGGRQISQFGRDTNLFRITEGTREDRAMSTDFQPLISVRHKTGFESILVELAEIDMLSDSDGIFEIQRNATLDSNADFSYVGNQTESEKAIEIDVSAGDTFTSGEAIYRSYFVGGSGQNLASVSADLPKRSLSELDTWTLAARTISGTGSINLSIFKLREFW